MAAFADAAGLDLVHVPYRGNGPMLADLLAGRVKCSFAGSPVVLPAARDNRLIALAVSAPQPSALVPGVPPAGRAVPGYEMLQWHSLVAPAATPPELVARINGAINGFLSDPEMVQRLAVEGAEPAPRSPAELRTLIAAELERFRVLVARANIKAD
jgi:tripartite-type tricarboxylate transporter receptor subunit TctC